MLSIFTFIFDSLIFYYDGIQQIVRKKDIKGMFGILFFN